MATTTPNFGWPVPTSTDLVKDGATAIEALGDSIDASLLDLKGGTTGQILAKTSATDLDFVWTTPNPGDITGVTAGTGISGGGTSGDVTVTNSMATAITTKGDLVPGTGSGTFARLAVGATNNTVLTVDSTQATGLKYSADWTSYTPSWTSSGTAPALGNGTLTGKYLQVGKNVIVQIFFQAGSTTTFGTNEWRFSLPFASYELSGNAGGHPAAGYAEDSGVAAYQILSSRKSGGASTVALFTSVSGGFSNTSPFTWGTNDFINFELVYGVA